MPPRILVRGELSPWVHAGRVLFALAGAGGVVTALSVAPWGWLIAAAGAALWLIFEYVAWQARRVRTWLSIHPDGIEIEDPHAHRAIHDSQISAVALERKKNLLNGELSSVTRRFTLWIEDDPEPVRMKNNIKIGAFDPLAGLIERVLARLEQRMEQDLARGGTATGDDWHLSRSALTIGRSPNDQQLPLSEIAAIEAFDNQMCVWQRGVDLAVAKLPLSGRNVFLLPALVRPFLAPTSETEAAAEASIGLGRVLFERRPSRGIIMVLLIVGIAMTASGAAMVASFASLQNMNEGLLAAGLILLVAGAVLGLLGLWLSFASFRCHERGVCKKTLLSQKTLRYSDVGGFQFSAVRHYHHGAYVGTHVTMRFRPLTPDRDAAINYSTRVQGEDDDLDNLRDHVSRALATRMAEQLRTGQTVPWTKNLEFTPDGIRYRPGGFFGRKPPQLLPYADYGGYQLKQAVFRLFAQGNKKPLLSEQASAPNFYPGFFLLQMLLHEPAKEESAAR